MPVTHGVAGSNPVHSALIIKQLHDKCSCFFYAGKAGGKTNRHPNALIATTAHLSYWKTSGI